ncbi:MAG: M14 family zinc carboxypeptidase [Ignavibacteria bacterium]|nr:M14 family zinc carboxypeptidase [Ignavibacteria bacterium]
MSYKISIILIIASSFIYLNFTYNHDSNKTKYSQVRILTNSPADILTLQNNDICVEHYQGNITDGLVLVLNQSEMQRLKATGIKYNVEIWNTDEFYNNRTLDYKITSESRNLMESDNVRGLTYGSMGGYYTFSEVVQKLDSMRLLYPNLITAKQNIGTSVEGRTIWAVKISDNPDINESATEPAVYFDALHHAREPQSMASLMYFMYWILENYNTNPEAKYLADNREIFCVPVVNPDGYVYNQTTNPNGGGMWRKNRRNNGSCFGVDLNRNYDYGWGNNNGSSGDPCSETYRGPSPASEPETQAIKNFCNQIQPKIAFSVHSVAGRYLNPYGYNDTAISYEIYSDFSSEFAAGNDYTYGTVFEMLNYYSSGTTRDWLHSRGCYAWTPEVGGSGFWPAISEIIPVASENLDGFKYLSWVAGAFASFQNHTIFGNHISNRLLPSIWMNDTISINIGVRNKGLSKPAQNVNVQITSPYSHAVPITSSQNYATIQPRQTVYNSNPFRFRLTNNANYMDEIRFIVTVRQENVITSIDTISVLVARANVIFRDNAENGTSRWIKSGNQIQWDTTFCDYFSESHSFADSRYGNSRNSTNNFFTLADTINLTGTTNPRIEFQAKWATEVTNDYVRLQISTNFGTTWINLPGKYTENINGQPSYHRIHHWISERINLNPYIGQRIRIRFNYVTNTSVPGDGFYFDNFRIINYTDSLVSVSQNGTSIPKRYALYQNLPNPFNPSTKIKFDLPERTFVKLKVYDINGKELKKLFNGNIEAGSYEIEFTGNDLPSGVYFYRLETESFTQVRKMILIK